MLHVLPTNDPTPRSQVLPPNDLTHNPRGHRYYHLVTTTRQMYVSFIYLCSLSWNVGHLWDGFSTIIIAKALHWNLKSAFIRLRPIYTPWHAMRWGFSFSYELVVVFRIVMYACALLLESASAWNSNLWPVPMYAQSLLTFFFVIAQRLYYAWGEGVGETFIGRNIKNAKKIHW